MVSLLVCDKWLKAPQLASLHDVVRAHRALRERGGEGPSFSWYSAKQRCHISRLSDPHLEVVQSYVDDLVSRLGPVLDGSAEGYEWWSNDDNDLGWHADRDETLYRERGEIRHPSWSTILYTDVSIRGHGGELALLSEEDPSLPYRADLSSREIPQKHHTISPRTNRLVVFRDGLFHRINPFHGQRASLALNVWGSTPVGFEAYRASPWLHGLVGDP